MKKFVVKVGADENDMQAVFSSESAEETDEFYKKYLLDSRGVQIKEGIELAHNVEELNQYYGATDSQIKIGYRNKADDLNTLFMSIAYLDDTELF